MLNTSSFKKSIITNILLKKKTFHRLQHNIASFKILVGKHTQAYTHTYYITTNKKTDPDVFKNTARNHTSLYRYNLQF